MTQMPPPESNVALAVRDLVVCFQDSAGQVVTAVAGADLTVRRGQTTALVGESGSGKSQLLHAILGLTSGRPGVIQGAAGSNPRPVKSFPSSCRSQTADRRASRPAIAICNGQ